MIAVIDRRARRRGARARPTNINAYGHEEESADGMGGSSPSVKSVSLSSLPPVSGFGAEGVDAGINVTKARARLAGRIRRTPIIEVESGGRRVLLKLEHLQETGSFKIRGALNAMLRAGSPEHVITASGGNHGIAVAVAARMVGSRASVYVPDSTPPSKTLLIEAAGAELIRVPGDFDVSYGLAREEAARLSAHFIPSFDAAAVVEGQATLGAEIVEDAPDVDTIVVAAGGGGLAAGIALGAAARRVAVTEPEGCCAVSRALEAGYPVESTTDSMASDALGSRFAGALPLRLLQEHDVTSVLVSEDEIRRSQKALWEDFRILAEPAASVAYAAWLADRVGGDRVCVVICGANGNPHPLGEALAAGDPGYFGKEGRAR
jgi:threonine dehydratase